MSVALVFSGQGAQHAAMLPWLDEGAPLVRATAAALGAPDWRTRLHDPGWAACNRHAQPLLTGLALAAWQQLAPALPTPVGIAGYSVGELPAYAAAGVFDADTALALAVARADAMDRAAAASPPGGLIGVTGLGADAVDTLCAATGLACAIRNGPDSVVLGGPEAALADGTRRAEAQGGRVTRLAVALASHTPAMAPAAAAFGERLVQTGLRRPTRPLFGNAVDRVRSADDARDALARQIATTVRWDAAMDALHARRPACVLEIGPGQALAKLWNARHPDVPARSVDEFRSAGQIAAWVEARSAA